MKSININPSKLSLITSLVFFGLVQNVLAASTMVKDAVGTKELWTFQEVLGAQKLTSKINQADGKGISQTWDANGNKLSRTDAEGRVTTSGYNATNQRVSTTEAFGRSETRTVSYEYVNADIDLVTKTISPSIHSNSFKEVVNTYDASQNVTAVTISGFDAAGSEVRRATTFNHDVYGKVIEINGPRTDVNDITVLGYYDCDTGAECGQLAMVTNAAGHISSYDSYDAASRLTQSTGPNGVVTGYTYHPRGWLLSVTQTPPNGAIRTTVYEYDSVGQLTKTTLPDGTEQNYVYDAAHDLRQIFDNLGNRVSYTYDAKGNRTDELISDPNGTLVRSTVTSYDMRNFVKSINTAGSITRLINDAVGNIDAQTDPNINPNTLHYYDALDRLYNTIDALGNPTAYQFNIADQLDQVTAPNGASTHYEYDDLGNQTKEISPDRRTLIYSHDDAGNVLSISDDRGITRSYHYDTLNRLLSVAYPDPSENITYRYDNALSCGFGIGRLCQINDESGQTNYEYDAWGNIIRQTKLELSKTYITGYQYDAQNRVEQITYPSGRLVNYQRDAIGRISAVTTTVNGVTTDVLSNRHYRADGLVTQQILGNGVVENRSYDLQGRTEQIALGSLETIDYSYDANGNILQLNKPVENRVHSYDPLDRLSSDRRGSTGQNVGNFSYQYDGNGNRTKRNNWVFSYQANTNQMIQNGSIAISKDAIGNTLNFLQNRSFTYNQAGRLTTVSRNAGLQATYTYNAQNQRTRSDFPVKSSRVFHYDLQGQLLMRSNEHGTPIDDYIWVDGEPRQYSLLIGNASDGSSANEINKTYFTPDHLNSPRLGTNDSQVISWRWDSDGFGIKAPNRDPDGDGTNVSPSIRFPGQYYDNESSLVYNWNRYYDRLSGRYITSDPIGLDGGKNTYGYVHANPLSYTDPKGLATTLSKCLNPANYPACVAAGMIPPCVLTGACTPNGEPIEIPSVPPFPSDAPVVDPISPSVGASETRSCTTSEKAYCAQQCGGSYKVQGCYATDRFKIRGVTSTGQPLKVIDSTDINCNCDEDCD